MKKKSFAILLVRSSKTYKDDILKMLKKLEEKGYDAAACQYQTMIESNASIIYYNSEESSVNIQDYITTEGVESNLRQSLQVTFYVPASDYNANELDCLYRWLDVVYIKAGNDMEKFITHSHITHRVYILD